MFRTIYRTSLILAVIALILASSVHCLAANSSSIRGSSYYALKIDGQSGGLVKDYSGGGFGADVTEQQVGPDRTKHVAELQYYPATLLCDFSLPSQLCQCISDTWKRVRAYHDFALGSVNPSGGQTETDFSHALVADVTFPACDGESEEAGFLGIQVYPEVTTSTTSTGGSQATQSGTTWISCDFTLKIDGLDCKYVKKIDSFTVQETIVMASSGGTRGDVIKVPGKLTFPNLKITVSEDGADSWRQWADDFLVKGNNDSSHEKTGRLTFYSKDLSKPLATIVFHNLGICKLERVERDGKAEAIEAISVELYCEQMEFFSGSGPSDTNAVSTPASRNEAGEESIQSQEALKPNDDCQLGQRYRIGRENPVDVSLNKIEYTVGRVKTGDRYSMPGRGEKLIVAHYTLRNPADTDTRVGSVTLDWKFTDSNNYNTEWDFVGVEATGASLDQTLTGGQSINCFVVFRVPATGAAVTLVAAPHASRGLSARYNLKDKIAAIQAPYVDPKDPAGSTPLSTISGKMGTSYMVGDCDYRVDSIEIRDLAIPDTELVRGKTYAVATVQCTSYAEVPFNVTGNSFQLTDVNGQTYDSGDTIAVGSSRPVDLTAKPGETMKFRLPFQVPKGVKLKTLTMKDNYDRSVVISL